MDKKPFYITTPIYYPNDNVHIGHTYCTVATDTVKRFKEFQGYDVFFTTGSDEHGQKLEETAEAHGMKPLEYIDGIVDNIKELWEKLDIDYDAFIRSTDPQHQKNVQEIFTKLYEKGEIYKDFYEGPYCTPCESFWSEAQLVDGLYCPDCGRPTHIEKEETYFFKLSKYTDKILKLYEDNPEFLQPKARVNEMVNNFLKDGLDDLSVTRSSFDWGVKVPFDEKHVVYVWIDALSCYLTAIGYGHDEELFNKYWPANVHFVGKEIVRFHAIIWPALLMALDLPLPEKIFGHGWILFDNDKMSKSKGNIVYPEPIIELYGNDALKYFLLREFSFGQDGSFNREKLLNRFNSDLANDLGNLVSRTVSMIYKYNDGIVPEPSDYIEVDEDLKSVALSTLGEVEKYMENYDFSNALEAIWKLIRRSNKYVDETEPWILAREEDKTRLFTVLYNLAESLRIVSVLIQPFIHNTSEKIREQLGLSKEVVIEDAKTWGLLVPGTKVNKSEIIFPRLEVDKELERLVKANDDLIESRAKDKSVDSDEKSKPDITIDDFGKLDIRVAKVLKVENHPNADRLYLLHIVMGKIEKTIVSSIKDYYKPEDLEGKKILVLNNLKPHNFRGIESAGMLLAAEDDEGNLSLCTTMADMPDGITVG